jgi:beta-phosphoglucomutase
MIKAVIFDMDGVIINSEPMHQKAYRMMFEKFNLNVSEQLYTSFTGMATLPICEKLCEVFALDHSPQVLVDTKRYFFKQLFENGEELKLIDGVLELIQHYHQLKITLILASSASMANINMTFQKFNLDPYFKAKISGAELKASKPHPEIFEKAVTLSGVSKEACFVIEDATNGIIAAKAAGLFCVAFDGGHSQHQNYTQADRVVTDFKSLQLENLKQLFEN